MFFSSNPLVLYSFYNCRATCATICFPYSARETPQVVAELGCYHSVSGLIYLVSENFIVMPKSWVMVG